MSYSDYLSQDQFGPEYDIGYGHMVRDIGRKSDRNDPRLCNDCERPLGQGQAIMDQNGDVKHKSHYV